MNEYVVTRNGLVHKEMVGNKVYHEKCDSKFYDLNNEKPTCPECNEECDN